MALRPLIRPRPRVTAPSVTPSVNVESLEGLPRVLSRVGECYSQMEQPAASPVPCQPTAIAKSQPVRPASSKSTASEAKATAAEKPSEKKPTLPAYWKSRKVLVAAGIAVIATAVAIGYQFRPKQQIIVVHPAKQPSTIATTPANSINPASTKPAFQPLSPATPSATVSGKETTSTATLMPGAKWPAEKTPAAAPLKSPTPPFQTATKPVDTRTSSNHAPGYSATQEPLPQMSPQYPQAPNSNSNAAVVYNPTMNAAASPLASNFAPQNNLPPQNNGPMYTAARPNIPQNMQPGHPSAPQDGSFGAYGGARFEGQIQPLPLRR